MSRHRDAADLPPLDGSPEALPVTLVGHPYAPIGMGQQLRSHLSACRAVHVDARVYDVFRSARRGDPEYAALLGSAEIDALPGGIRIFHINGDEVEPVLAALKRRRGRFAAGYNVVVPAWELPAYPAEWARLLEGFDEVWALSAFIQRSLAAAGVASHLVGQSVQAQPGALLPRRFFGLSESAFVLLTMFDVGSFARRKNPEAALLVFERLCRERRLQDLQLVVKVKHGEKAATEWLADWGARLRGPRVRVIADPLDSLGVRSLLNACDVFLSLHRSEGFGRGLGEAMALGRLAMGTGWSGNVDFMTDENALLVRQRLVPVRRHEYPHARGQHWAEPDLDHAAAVLGEALDNPQRSRARAASGKADVLRTHGHRAVGLRILDRLQRIAADAALRQRLGPQRARMARARISPGGHQSSLT